MFISVFHLIITDATGLRPDLVWHPIAVETTVPPFLAPRGYIPGALPPTPAAPHLLFHRGTGSRKRQVVRLWSWQLLFRQGLSEGSNLGILKTTCGGSQTGLFPQRPTRSGSAQTGEQLREVRRARGICTCTRMTGSQGPLHTASPPGVGTPPRQASGDCPQPAQMAPGLAFLRTNLCEKFSKLK